MSRSFVSQGKNSILTSFGVFVTLMLLLSLGPLPAYAVDNESGQAPSISESAEPRVAIYTYKVPRRTIRKARNFCGRQYSSTTAVGYCRTGQFKRKTQTQVVKTRRYWMSRKSSMDAAWWDFYIRPLLVNDRKQLRSTNSDLLAQISKLCAIRKCDRPEPSKMHLVKGWDWVGGTYVGVLLSRRLTVKWSRELSAIDAAAAGAGFACGKIPKAGTFGVLATGACVAVVALKYGGIKSDFGRAKEGDRSRCVELRFHTLYSVGLADASKVVKCRP